MIPFNIIRKKRIFSRIIASGIGIFLLIVNLILIIKSIKLGIYDGLFFCFEIVVILAILLLLRFTLWGGPKVLFEMTDSKITSKLRAAKFTIDWVNVSAINISRSNLIFLLNGEKYQRKIDLQRLNYVEGKDMLYVVHEIAERKNISLK